MLHEFFCGNVENILPPPFFFDCNSDMTAVTEAALNCYKGNNLAASLQCSLFTSSLAASCNQFGSCRNIRRMTGVKTLYS